VGVRDGPTTTGAQRRPLGVGASHADVIVIGSGFGGAVSAARLAEHGLRVLLLERGPWWGDTSAAPGGRRRPFPRGLWGLRNAVRDVRSARGKRGRCVVFNRGGLLAIHRSQRLTAVTASGVGGGSLIYADVQAQPDGAFFDYLPAEISDAEMHPYYQRVREALRPSPLPDRPARTVAFERAVASCGFAPVFRPELAVAWPPADATGRARRSSSYLLGCEYPGKRSLDRTYIPQAIGRGADVRSLSEVVALERGAGGYRVHWVDHAARRRYWAEAPLVVVAAGTLGTLRLLFAARDRDRSLQLPPALGRGFSVGGDMMMTVYDSPAAGESGYGPCPGAGILVAEDGELRFVIAEMDVPVDALPLPNAVRRRLLRSVILAGMGRDASTGTVEFDGRELRTATDRSLDPQLFAELNAAMTQIARAYRPTRISPSVDPESDELLTVHPFGGAAIANGPHDGVVDHTGQVFGNPGLYVADGALFPRAPGLPPAMTIAALAERQAAPIGQHGIHGVSKCRSGLAR